MNKKRWKLLKKANEKNITIYTIGLGDKDKLNEDLLKQLAYETGGQYYHAKENIDISEIYQTILSEITCGYPALTCISASSAFRSPSLEYTDTDFYMNTFINERCGTVDKVVLRLSSTKGDIDYVLIPRGQNLFALTKNINQI